MSKVLEILTEKQTQWIYDNQDNPMWSKDEVEFLKAVLMNGCYGNGTKNRLNAMCDYFRFYKKYWKECEYN